jgi:phytoene dehydrogenase-like protein
LIDALVGVLREAGGELRCDAEVVRLHVAAGRVGAVELACGERIAARRAVIANLTPGVLFGSLLADAPLHPRVRRAAAGYRYGPATLMLHLALAAPVRWSAGEDLEAFSYLHIGPYADDLDHCDLEASAGLLPREPLLIVGQSSMLDPTRAPDGRHVLWVQVRTVPYEIKGDAAGQIGARDWESAAEPFADRVLGKLERYAPGIRDVVLRQHVITPVELERDNPNLVRGDSLGGSMHLRQNLLLRPLPGLSGYASGVDGLLLVGAATWPGAGVNALSGYHVARQLIAPRRRRLESARLAGDALRALRRSGR